MLIRRGKDNCSLCFSSRLLVATVGIFLITSSLTSYLSVSMRLLYDGSYMGTGEQNTTQNNQQKSIEELSPSPVKATTSTAVASGSFLPTRHLPENNAMILMKTPLTPPSQSPTLQLSRSHSESTQAIESSGASDAIATVPGGPRWFSPHSLLLNNDMGGGVGNKFVFSSMHSVANLSGRAFFELPSKRRADKRSVCRERKSRCKTLIRCGMITLDKTNPQNVIVLKYECLAQFSAWLAKRQAIADAASANPSVAALKAYEGDAPNQNLRIVCCLSAWSWPGAKGVKRSGPLSETALSVANHPVVRSAVVLNLDQRVPPRADDKSRRKKWPCPRSQDDFLNLPCGPALRAKGDETVESSFLTAAASDRWLLELASSLRPLSQRRQQVKADFMFAAKDQTYYPTHERERKDAAKELQIVSKKGNVLAPMQERRLNQRKYYEYLGSFQASICPPGNGWDTHRFWETLILGSIAIVKREGPLTSWLESFTPNVVLVNSYLEVTPSNLAMWVAAIEHAGTANMIPEEVLLSHWQRTLHAPLPPRPLVYPKPGISEELANMLHRNNLDPRIHGCRLADMANITKPQDLLDPRMVENRTLFEGAGISRGVWKRLTTSEHHR